MQNVNKTFFVNFAAANMAAIAIYLYYTLLDYHCCLRSSRATSSVNVVVFHNKDGVTLPPAGYLYSKVNSAGVDSDFWTTFIFNCDTEK